MLHTHIGRVTPARDARHLASSIDIAPTILSACGLKPTQDMPGVSLLDPAALAGRKAIFGEAFAHDMADLADPTKSLAARWCVEGKWKLIVPHGARGRARRPPKAPAVPARAELYDLLADPHERTNLAARHADVVRRLRRLIDAWWPARPRGT